MLQLCRRRVNPPVHSMLGSSTPVCVWVGVHGVCVLCAVCCVLCAVCCVCVCGPTMQTVNRLMCECYLYGNVTAKYTSCVWCGPITIETGVFQNL